jgi:hypothetical protein
MIHTVWAMGHEKKLDTEPAGTDSDCSRAQA